MQAAEPVAPLSLCSPAARPHHGTPSAEPRLPGLQAGKPDYSWQTADRLAALQLGGHDPDLEAGPDASSKGLNGAPYMNGDAAHAGVPNSGSGPSWGMGDMPPKPASAKTSRPTRLSSGARRRGEPGEVELLPSNSVPSHLPTV